MKKHLSISIVSILALATPTMVGAQNLFVGDPTGNGNIYEFTPSGAQSTFASGAALSTGLAFNNAGDLFATSVNGDIYEYTPGGTQSTFATGLSNPIFLAFNSAGDLFDPDDGSGNIYEFTPGGVQSTFASGLTDPEGAAFNSAGDLFVATLTGYIYEYTPGGVQSTFASGLGFPQGIAFQPIPEPSDWAMFGMSGLALLGLRRRARVNQNSC